MKRIVIAAIVVVIVIVAIFFAMQAASKKRSTPRYLTAAAAYGDVAATIGETGTVNPITQVQVGSQVSGTIATLNADYNSVVKKGQVLATIDPTSFQDASMQAHEQLSAAQATAAAAVSSAHQSAETVRNAVANENVAAANVQSAEANLRKAQAQLALSQITVQRDHDLVSKGFIAQSQADTDTATERSNEADVNAAQSALVSAKATAAAAPSQVQSAVYQSAASQHQATAAAAQMGAVQGSTEQADYNLGRTTVTSPIDGIVVSRSISIGQTVAASFQTPTLFVIASNLKDMQVDVNVSEADVGNLKPGAPAQITVPAYPYVVFRGTVSQVRVNPTTVQNVVTYDAVVSVHDTSARLRPGMTANVTIAVSTEKHVLTVPTAALLFRPAGTGPASPSGFFNAGANSTPPPVAGAAGSHVVVWVLRIVNGEARPAPVPVVLGLTDGRNYEIRSGELRPGDKVIIGQLLTTSFTPSGGPFGRVGR